jgi:hypothetical protein
VATIAMNPVNPQTSSRRRFLRHAVGLGGALALPAALQAQAKAPLSETLVASLHGTLSPQQKAALCFPFDHPLRREVDNNWHVTEKSIRDFLTGDQQQMMREILCHYGVHAWDFNGY